LQEWVNRLLARRPLRLVRLPRTQCRPQTHFARPAEHGAGAREVAYLQGFPKADAGTRTPDPLLTMQSTGLAHAAGQSRLASGIHPDCHVPRGLPMPLDTGRYRRFRPQTDDLGSGRTSSVRCMRTAPWLRLRGSGCGASRSELALAPDERERELPSVRSLSLRAKRDSRIAIATELVT
jgi:hypothetical protein